VQTAGLVLSVFPGIDLFGRGFEECGFCIVRGPDLITGGDARQFRAPRKRFDGVIAGTPCPDFSSAQRGAPTGYGADMIEEFRRIVIEAAPAWWWHECVPAVPDVKIPGYSWLRIPIDARDFGARQRRLRHFQFGHRDGFVPVIVRHVRAELAGGWAPACMASEANRPGRRSWEDFCALQGLPRSFTLPGFTLSARYRAVGNGVHLGVARALAAATRDLRAPGEVTLCACGCARPVEGKRTLALAACRKRMQRRRDAAIVTGPGPVTDVASRDRPGCNDAGAVTVTELVAVDASSVTPRAAASRIEKSTTTREGRQWD
jgi:DNA (cytosine-5)-methyltransferase 1